MRHIPALDGIRGLAIVLVLGVHLFVANRDTGSRVFDTISAILGSGYVGVNLFFVLSGFLITGILLDTVDAPAFFKTFYARRTLRIFPLYYGVLLLLALLTRPMGLHWGGWAPFLFTYTSNLWFWRAHQLIPLSPFNINQFWSLQVEEQFYLVWPFLVYWLREPAKLIRVALAGCSVIFLLRLGIVLTGPHPNVYLPYSPTFSCADNLLFGCCLCALLRTKAREKALRLAPAVFWLGSAAVIAMALRPRSRTQTWFGNPVLTFFGRYSYGLYVFHYSIAAMIAVPVRFWLNAHLHSKAIGVLGSAIAVLALSIAVALLSYHFYEAPFLRLKRYFSYRASAKKVALST
jgi:peptidoglycan/LPS O-acetylase OafA/YrhL